MSAFSLGPETAAPAAAFLAVALLTLGVYWLANRPGLVARRRLAVFAPGQAASGMSLSGPAATMALREQRRFSSVAALNHFLREWHWGDRLAGELERSGLPLRAGEYLLLRCLLALLAAVAASWGTDSAILAAMAAVVAYAAPAFYVRRQQVRRAR
ncbi:MAG: hypothetical protein ACHQ7M_12325, partial [Chloroflexota bacterium]